MFYLYLIDSFKRNSVTLISFIFIVSLFFENTLRINSGIYRISIVEVIFIIFILSSIIIFKKRLLIFLINFKSYNFFDFLIISILLLKIIKLILNINNFFNLYELLIWIYMLCIYQIYKFLIFNDNKNIKIIENAFISLSLIISISIIISLIIYILNIQGFNLWINRELTYLPYMGTSTIHFTGLFSNYNHPAHLIIPGFLFLIKNNNKFFKQFILFLFFFIIFYLIKSKVLIIFFACSIFISLKNILKFKFFLSKKIYSFYLLLITTFYFLITHFIVIKSGVINTNNSEIFDQYFFTDYVIYLYNYEIYGSLFLKLKYITVLIAQSYNYFFFNDINYFQNNIILDYFNEYTDPHSEYFGALANYGVIGFIILLLLPLYFIFNFFKNFNYFITEDKNLYYFFIIFIFLIEGLVLDFLHNQVLWIIFAIFNYNLLIKKNNQN